MKFARFLYEDKVFFGSVKKNKIAVLDGSIFGDFEETKVEYILSEVKLLPPVLPTKIVCFGMNYIEHIEEIGAKVPGNPHFFLKPPSSLIGHEDAIVFPRIAERVDYEGELALVIKKKMKDISEQASLDYLLGCSCFNDVTERAMVEKGLGNLSVAKGFDTFSVLGPFVVTDIDPNNLQLRTYVNGVMKQNDNTKNCVFNVQRLLSYLSECMTLYPGDVLTTGTPKGVGELKPGDVVEVEIDGIGRLRNSVTRQR